MQPSTGPIPTNSAQVVSLGITTRTRSYLSLLVRGYALVGGKFFRQLKRWTLLTQRYDYACALRFSEIELIAVLSVIVLHYRITILEEPQYTHETVEERKMRLLARRTKFTVEPIRIPVMFTPREGMNVLAY